MEARKVTFTAKPGTFRDAVRAYKKYKEEKEQCSQGDRPPVR